MAKLNLHQIHVHRKVPGSQAVRLVEINPAMRFKLGDETVWLQHGKFFSDGGTPIAQKDAPGWLAAEMAKVSPAGLAEAGWKPKAV